VKSLLAHSGPIWGIAIDENRTVATCSWDKSIIIWAVPQK